MKQTMMKRIILSAAALLFSLASYAQEPQKEPDFYELAEKETERLQRTVKLEDWQIFYVDSILVHDYMAMNDDLQRLQANKVSNSSIYQSIQDKWMEKIDNAFRKFFTDEQWAAYLKQGAAKAQKARAKRAAKRSGN